MNENSYNDIDATRSLLREIADLCEHASLTGSLQGGAGRVAQRYNAVLARFTESGVVPRDMFSYLSETAEYGEIGVEARMLSSYLRKDEAGTRRRMRDGEGDHAAFVRLAPFISREDLASLVRQQVEGGTRIDMGMLTQLAPFLGQEDLGQLLREHLRTPTPPEREQAPEPPPTPPAPPAPGRQEWPTIQFNEAPQPPAEEKLSSLLERLKDPRLSEEERSNLVERIRGMTAG
ncbi:hypothetical protein [Fimbriimonas ginsengisoli]|uniref:Uncharacterized protein n=1 Tax=Fimbriimonas ginsengisoli Gsoil 348 TaxID=661478 RepID=A0A068NUL1_FIMGI|nr:hypothetical protein [Fimbriimonas ginsengisoli]AIE87111.1 hypothetical protein OP10G_3743 [Fimbriimonas ginsengisoli Gsoil 348]